MSKDNEARALLRIAEADCGCRIPSPFDEVAEHAIALAFAKEATPSASVEGALRTARDYVLCVIEAEPFEHNKRDLAEIDAALASLTLPVPSAPRGSE